MLPLDSPAWNHFHTQTGRAGNVPGLIRRWQAAIGRAEEEDCWDDLWSEFLYEFEITDLAYAVIPHIAVALDRVAPEHWIDYLWVIDHVQIARLKPDAPSLPPELADSYQAALKQAARIASQALSLNLSKHDFKSVVAAICSLHGHSSLAEVLGRLPPSRT